MSKEIKKTPFSIETTADKFTADMLPHLEPLEDDPDYIYTFQGWYNGSMKIEPGKSLLGDMTLEAKWKKKSKNNPHLYYSGFAANNYINTNYNFSSSAPSSYDLTTKVLFDWNGSTGTSSIFGCSYYSTSYRWYWCLYNNSSYTNCIRCYSRSRSLGYSSQLTVNQWTWLRFISTSSGSMTVYYLYDPEQQYKLDELPELSSWNTLLSGSYGTTYMRYTNILIGAYYTSSSTSTGPLKGKIDMAGVRIIVNGDEYLNGLEEIDKDPSQRKYSIVGTLVEETE